MPTHRELFGEDSSSSAEEDDNAGKIDDTRNESNQPATTTLSSTPTAAGVTDKNTSLTTPETATTADGVVAGAAAAPTRNNTASNQHVDTTNDNENKNDDDDDDDALFDDKAVVQGLSSTTLAGTVKGPTRMEVDNKDPDNNHDSANTEQHPTRDPRGTLVVQELPPPQRPTTTSTASSSPTIFMTKVPNLLGIQPRAFETPNHHANDNDDDAWKEQQKQEEALFGPQAAHHLIRWRYKENNTNDNDNKNEAVRESNTRLVQWQDDSWTLHIGQEVFHVELQDSSDPQTGFAGLNGYLYLSQKASWRRPQESPDDNNNNNNNTTTLAETTTTPAGTALECLSAVHRRLTIRPLSLQSAAHQSLTLAVRQKTIKRARIAEFTTTQDPEQVKQTRMRMQQDLERAAVYKGTSSYAGGTTRGTRTAGGRRPRMAKSYLEEEEDDRDFDTTNIRAMKKRMFDRDLEDDDYGDEFDNDDDEDESEDETFHRVRPKGSKGKKKVSKQKDDNDDEEEDVFGGDEEDDDEKVAPVVNVNKKRTAQSMFDDDDSD